MRPEKKNITKEYLVRLNASPFFIVVNYKGLKVSHFTELRKRLTKATSELHVVKNSIFRIAAKEAGIGEMNGALTGQLAVVTGQRDISAAAKVLKSFGAEVARFSVRFVSHDNKRAARPDRMTAASWASIELMRGNL